MTGFKTALKALSICVGFVFASHASAVVYNAQPINAYVNQDNLKSASEAFINQIKAKKGFLYAKLKLESIDAFNGNVIPTPDANIVQIKFDVVNITVSGVPPTLFVYKPTLTLEANLNLTTCQPTIVNTDSHVVANPLSLTDSAFNADLNDFGNVLFTTLMQQSSLKTLCH